MATVTSSPANLWVDASGVCRDLGNAPALLRRFPNRRPYRLYRFLSDLDDLVEAVKDDRQRLQVAVALVRRFLASASWLTESLPMPDEERGWAVHTLYKEPDYPFAVQLVSWLPGVPSPVHNHATWSVVAVMGESDAGREKNSVWRRVDDGSREGYAEVELAEERLLYPGDVIGFTPEAIHSVEMEAAPESWLPTFTFNVYGEPDYSQRYEFDPDRQSAKHF